MTRINGGWRTGQHSLSWARAQRARTWRQCYGPLPPVFPSASGNFPAHSRRRGVLSVTGLPRTALELQGRPIRRSAPWLLENLCAPHLLTSCQARSQCERPMWQSHGGVYARARCVCVCVCVCARARARTHAYMDACKAIRIGAIAPGSRPTRAIEDGSEKLPPPGTSGRRDSQIRGLSVVHRAMGDTGESEPTQPSENTLSSRSGVLSEGLGGSRGT